MEDSLRVVVAGEVDAGKSTLIGRFLYEMGCVPKGTVKEGSLAYLLDSLEEERKGSLTIDTTQVFCKNKKGRGFLFIDVPGHRELLRNALCGSSYAQAAILVVDMLNPVQAGARRHIDILKFLGIEKVITVFNKADLADFDRRRFRDAQGQIAGFFDKQSFACAGIIPVSAAKGDNLVKKSKRMSWYKGPTLLAALTSLSKGIKEKKNRDLCYPVQDIYNIDKQKFIVGPLLCGALKKGQVVRIAPSAKSARIKSIRVFNHEVNRAGAPEPAGLELEPSAGIDRGQIIYDKIPPAVVNRIDAKIYCVQTFNTADKFIFKCLTQEAVVSVQKVIRVINTSGTNPDFKKDILEAGDVAEVSLALQKPVAIKKYRDLESLGRFVLDNNRQICAVGMVV